MTSIKYLLFSILSLIFSFQVYSQRDIYVKGATPILKGDLYYVAVLSSKDSTLLDFSYFDTPEFMLKRTNDHDFILKIYSPVLSNNYQQKITNKENTPIIDLGFIQLELLEDKRNELQFSRTLFKAKLKEEKYNYIISSRSQEIYTENNNHKFLFELESIE